MPEALPLKKRLFSFRRQALEVIDEDTASQNIINARVGWDDDFMNLGKFCLWNWIEIYAIDA